MSQEIQKLHKTSYRKIKTLQEKATYRSYKKQKFEVPATERHAVKDRI